MLASLIISAVSLRALAADRDFGSSAVSQDQTYTLAEMLTYAIEDEYMAYAEYEAIIESFGVQRPFSNIIKAEATHIAALEPLFAVYELPLPVNSAHSSTVIPDSLTEIYRTGAQAEVNNIAMYNAFLSQSLPYDVRTVFTALRDASENHLAAFEKGLYRLDGTETFPTIHQRNRNDIHI